MTRISLNITALTLVLAAGVGLGATLFREPVPATAAAAETPVSDAPPAAPARPIEDIAPAAAYLGVVFARQSADIVARSEGALESVDANLGDRLRAGDVIARIDSYSLARQHEMAEATLRSAQADESDLQLEEREAQSRYERRQELAKEGLISQEDLATARNQVDRAQAKLQAAASRVAEQTAHVAEAKEALATAVVRAPFDGTVAARYLDAGAAVRFGTAIVSLMRPDDLWVRFAVSEPAGEGVRLGAPVKFAPTGSSRTLAGTIGYIAPAVTGTSQELIVEARLSIPPELGETLKPGAVGRVFAARR
jgi:RND family efflux transporter MFP subunit